MYRQEPPPVEAPKEVVSKIKRACDMRKCRVAGKCLSYLVHHNIEPLDVVGALWVHIDLAHKIYRKMLGEYAIPRFSYEGSLYVGENIQDAYENIKITHYMEIKGKQRHDDMPFAIFLHQHTKHNPLPIK